MVKIEMYKGNNTLPLFPANLKRQWMDENKNSYRCNPLTVANGYGWEFRSPSSFTVTWDDNGIFIQEQEPNSVVPSYHFGGGILTWQTGWLFKTPFPYALYVSAPVNTIIKNVTALTGIVETYWLPYPFTLNWKIQEPNIPIVVNKGDVLAQIFPVQINVFDDIDVEVKYAHDMSQELRNDLVSWSKSRHENPKTYQGFYHRGEIPNREYKELNRYSKINVPEVDK
jgi:hypothetical protein